MKAFLEYVVSGLVKHPESVSVSEVNNEGTTLYELRMHPDDVGKVIGKSGMTINAIRNLMLAGSASRGERCAVEIVEETPRHKEPRGRRRHRH